MSDYTISKPTYGVMQDPDDVQDAGFSRYGPLITGKQVKDNYLWGLPLYSRVTKEPFTEPMIDAQILIAIAELEAEVGINIFPTKLRERQAYDLNEFRSMGYMRLRQKPVSSIESLKVVASNDTVLWSVNLAWVDAGYLSKGLVYLLPLNLALVPSQTGSPAGAAIFISMMGSASWIGAFWAVEYTTGYADGKLPQAINSLIGIQTALQVLALLAATNAQTNSKSINIDGLGQSSSGPGPQIYDAAIKLLLDRKKMLVGKIKNQFGGKLFSGNV